MSIARIGSQVDLYLGQAFQTRVRVFYQLTNRSLFAVDPI